MPALFKNNATATLAASINSSVTTIVVSAGLGSLFPNPSGTSYFYGTLFDSAGNYEIVKCTAKTTDTLTVVRAQDNTNALAFAAGDGFALRPIAAVMDNFVQLDGTQTITGVKTFSGGLVGNVTGNTAGTHTGPVTGNVTGNASTSNNITNSGGWNVTPTGTKLYFNYDGANVASLDSSGNLIVVANVTAYGTP